jgi:HSP20 family protein
MSLIKWDPFGEFNTTGRLGSLLGRNWGTAPTSAWNPAVDILENENEIVIKAELPGLNAKDIEVKFENNVLVLKGERRFEKETKEENYHRIEREYGTFSRAFTVPFAVKSENVTAEYRDGVLKVVLPKKEEIKPKPIKIAAA